MTAACTGAVHKAPDGGGSCPCGLVTKVVAAPKRGGVSGEREELAAVLRKHRPRTGCFCRCGWEGDDITVHQFDALLPVVDRIANQRAAQALTQTANVWQYSVWADMPRSAGRVADRIEAAQFVTDWLRARADAMDPS